MKLILLLLAIYTLIFYQRYKIGKLKEPLSGTEIVSKEKLDQSPILQNVDNRRGSDILTEKHDRFIKNKLQENWEYSPLVFYK